MPRVSNRRQRSQQETPTNSASPTSSSALGKKAPKKSRKAVPKAKSNEGRYLKVQEEAKHCERMENLRSILKESEKDDWKYKPVDVLLGLTDRNK